MPPMQFTAQDYRDAAQACRSLAFIHQKDAENTTNLTIAKGFNDTARRYRELAQKYDNAATWL